MKKYSALIVDDEKGNRELLYDLLLKNCPQIDKINLAESAAQARSIIKDINPDVIFLDIEMPDGSGFDFLSQLDNIDFKIIFVTAYDSYALQAIKYSALDYLLKPLDINELKMAIEKLEEVSSQEQKVEILNHNLQPTHERRIALSTQDEVIFVKVGDIIRMEAEANYTKVYIQNEGPILLSGNIGHFEKLLSEQNFYRTHQSHLINPHKVKKYVKSEGGYLVMTDDSRIPVARMKREEFKKRFSL